MLNSYLFYVFKSEICNFLFNSGRLEENQTLSDWLDHFKASASVLIDATNFPFLINRLSPTEKILLLIYDGSPKATECAGGDDIKWWKNLGRSLADFSSITVGHVDLSEGTMELDEDSATRVEVLPR